MIDVLIYVNGGAGPGHIMPGLDSAGLLRPDQFAHCIHRALASGRGTPLLHQAQWKRLREIRFSVGGIDMEPCRVLMVPRTSSGYRSIAGSCTAARLQAPHEAALRSMIQKSTIQISGPIEAPASTSSCTRAIAHQSSARAQSERSLYRGKPQHRRSDEMERGAGSMRGAQPRGVRVRELLCGGYSNRGGSAGICTHSGRGGSAGICANNRSPPGAPRKKRCVAINTWQAHHP